MEDASKVFAQATVQPIRAPSSKLLKLAWNCDGSKLAGGSTAFNLRIWNINNTGGGHHSDYYDLVDHKGFVDHVCWNPNDPNIIASSSNDKTIKLWDVRGKDSVIATVTMSSPGVALKWTDDGRYIATASENNWISVIDYNMREIVKSKESDLMVFDVEWDNAGTRLFYSMSSGEVRVMSWPDEGLELLHTMECHTSSCYGLARDPTGRYLATGSADTLIGLWDLEEYICVRTIEAHEQPIGFTQFSFDGRFLASFSDDSFVNIADVDTGETAHQIKFKGKTYSIAWHPTKYILAHTGEELVGGRGRPILQFISA